MGSVAAEADTTRHHAATLGEYLFKGESDLKDMKDEIELVVGWSGWS